MIVTFAGFKGGVAKTTSAVHLACFLHQQGKKTLLVDGDPNRSALKWGERGSLPINVVTEKQLVRCFRDYEDIVIDTQARPSEEDLQELAGAWDLLILPSKPDRLSLEALLLTIKKLEAINCKHYRILLTLVPPPPETNGKEARNALEALELPIFDSEIRRFKVFEKASDEGIPV